MKTAIQQAIIMVKNRIETIDETLMGKHSIHHLQQVERLLYELLNEEKEQIIEALCDGHESHPCMAEQYYNETYKENEKGN